MLLLLLLAAGALGSAGCRSAAPRRVASSEPGLGGTGSAVADATPPAGTSTAWVDRHPLFSRPRQYYENSGNNKVVKVAAATVVGIPAGVVGELRQIVVGAPSSPRY